MILSNLTACGAALRHKEDAGVGAPPHGALTHAAHVLSPRRRALLAVPTTKQSLEQPSNCTAWLPQRRVYVESQAWFTLPGQNIDVDSTHLHIGACVPHRQEVWGDLVLHLVAQKHQFPRGATPTAPVGVTLDFTTKLGNGQTARYRLKPSAFKGVSWTCTAGNTLCKGVAEVTVKTYTGTTRRASVPDGVCSLSVTASVGGFNDGKNARSLSSRFSTTFLVNNRGFSKWPSNFKGAGVEQLANTGFPWGYTHADFQTDVPLAPLSGAWRFSVRQFVAGRNARTSNVTRLFISVDPNFHNPKAEKFTGRLVLVDNRTEDIRSKCPLAMGTMTPSCQLSGVELDTTQLAKGPHKLFIRTDSEVSPDHPLMLTTSSGAGTFSAVTLIVFQVCNDDPAACADASTTSPPDERPPLPALPPISPPPGTAWYNISDPLPPITGVVDAPYNCSGWKGARVYLEGHSWYTLPGDDVGAQSTQVLVGACLPHRGAVAGVVPIDVMTGKQYFPSNANVAMSILVRITWLGGEVTFAITKSGRQAKWNCAPLSAACKAVFRAAIDTRPANGDYYIPDGLALVEVETRASFNDSVGARPAAATISTFMTIANNEPTEMTGGNFAPFVTTENMLPWRHGVVTLTSDVPAGATSGAVGLVVQHRVGGGSGLPNVTGVSLALDPVFDLKGRTDPGHLLMEVKSPATGDRMAAPPPGCAFESGDGRRLKCAAQLRPAAVPIRCPLNPCFSGLCDGLHRLALRTDSYVPPDHPFFAGLPPGGRLNGGTVSTVMIAPLATANGVAPTQGACSLAGLQAAAAAAAAEEGGGGAAAPGGANGTSAAGAGAYANGTASGGGEYAALAAAMAAAAPYEAAGIDVSEVFPPAAGPRGAAPAAGAAGAGAAGALDVANAAAVIASAASAADVDLFEDARVVVSEVRAAPDPGRLALLQAALRRR